jgi:putative hydrolase of the HAD superfamily
VCDREDEKQLIMEHLFEGPVWLMADQGLITNEQRYEQVCPLLPPELHGKLKACVEQWYGTLTPMPGAREFCEANKAKGYHLYVLSNACNRFFTYFPKHYDLGLFDGIMVSSREHLVKPDPKIYERLMERYGLEPSECVFIDDRPENVAAAKALGMEGIVFEGSFSEITIS